MQKVIEVVKDRGLAGVVHSSEDWIIIGWK